MEQMNAFLNRIGKQFTEGWYEIRNIQQWMIDEIDRKRVQYPYFKKKVLFSWVSFNKNPGKSRQGKKIFSQPTWFYYKRLDEFFRFFLKNMFPFLSDKRLDLRSIDGQIESNGDLFFEYKYYLTPAEIQSIKEFKVMFNHPDHPHRIISYIFNLIVMIFGRQINEIIKDPTQISMLCAHIKQDPTKGEYIHFIIITRPAEAEFLQQYLRYEIFHFSEHLPNLPRELVLKLRNHKAILTKTALREYPNARNTIPNVFFTVLNKCLVLEECTPILDVLNFVCSQIEDSIFNTKVLVRAILREKFNYPQEILVNLEEIFDFFNRHASLFSTFQSNNRAMKERQYQLFFFYLQYYCAGGLEAMRFNPAFFFPQNLLQAIRKENFDRTYLDNTIDTLLNFIQLGVYDNPAIDIIFRKMFDQTIFEANEAFFESFLFSLNKRFSLLLTEIKTRNPDFDLTFQQIMMSIMIILYNLVLRVFISKNPKQAGENFRDKMGRYSPERLAIRVLELRVFKDIPLSDNNWRDYYLSRNKNYVKKTFAPHVDIPDHYFFSPERLLKINMIYDRGLLDSTLPLEEWLVQRIIKQFFAFNSNIRQQVEIEKKDLRTTLIEYYSLGIIDTRLRDSIEDFVNDFSAVWES